MELLRQLKGRLPWLGRHELGTLLSVCVLASGLWIFVEVADEVGEGDTQDLDQRLLLALRTPGDLGNPIGPPWLEEIGRDLTALGGVALLSLMSVAVVSHLTLRRKPKAALFVAGSVVGAVVLSLLLKHSFDRPRPNLVPKLSVVMTSSFPSGHSMLSAAVYLTLGALLARFEDNLWLKSHLLAWALLLTLLVGLSRVYVGVHWPTDVLAGWAAGGAWAALCWLGARLLQRRGTVEQEHEPAGE
jgi:undecaprenyl-diphosphatase